ncbi:MAG: peptidoglycan bridge formation glycyltransferase FemA/FemB family protein [Phycisphaerales bacterium]|nr:MAG: peptidoglycan bridge formation glycyltransferase FemA/FemB family protein [Phycisphaerales bacterium]
MAYEIIIDGIDRRQWEESARAFSDYNIYQTWAYQQVRAEMDGQELSRAVIKDEADRVVAMGQVRIKRVRWLGLAVGYVQWGPMFRGREKQTACLVEVLDLLRQAYLGTRINILRVAPSIFVGESDNPPSEMFQSGGFEHVGHLAPYRTMVFPLDISEDQMRRRLHRSWRRYLVKAERSDIEIREGADAEYFDILEALYFGALERKGFGGLDPTVFVRAQQLLSNGEKMNAVVAYCQGQPVAAHVTSHLGATGLGLLAAVNEAGLQCAASYLVWWRTLLAAKRAGMKRYDLGGIDPENNPRVFQFKSRIGSEEACHVGAFETCCNRYVRAIWRQAEKIHGRLKK